MRRAAGALARRTHVRFAREWCRYARASKAHRLVYLASVCDAIVRGGRGAISTIAFRAAAGRFGDMKRAGLAAGAAPVGGAAGADGSGGGDSESEPSAAAAAARRRSSKKKKVAIEQIAAVDNEVATMYCYDDCNVTADTGEWDMIQCDICDRWWHFLCLERHDYAVDRGEDAADTAFRCADTKLCAFDADDASYLTGKTEEYLLKMLALLTGDELSRVCFMRELKQSGSKTEKVTRIVTSVLYQNPLNAFVPADKAKPPRALQLQLNAMLDYALGLSARNQSDVLAKANSAAVREMPRKTAAERARALAALVTDITGGVAVPKKERHARLYLDTLAPLPADGGSLSIMGRLFTDVRAEPIFADLLPHVMIHFRASWQYHIRDAVGPNASPWTGGFTHYVAHSIVHWGGNHHHCHRCDRNGVTPGAYRAGTTRADVVRLHAILARAVHQYTPQRALTASPSITPYAAQWHSAAAPPDFAAAMASFQQNCAHIQ